MPDRLEQPESGDGWRLIGWTRGGEQRAPAIGEEALQLLGELNLRRMDRPVEPTNAETEIDAVVTHVVSGSCPQVRFDGFVVNRESGVVEAQLTDREDLLSLGGACTADANPVVYWIALERSVLPDGPFVLRTDQAPDVETAVDLGGEWEAGRTMTEVDGRAWMPRYSRERIVSHGVTATDERATSPRHAPSIGHNATPSSRARPNRTFRA